MRPRSRTTSAQRRLLFFKLCYGRGCVRPCGHRYITSCRWRTYDRYVRAGAGTSHECRDEVHTTIFDFFPLSHTSIVSPFSSLRSLLRTITCFAAGCHESRNPQNSAESYALPFILIFSYFPCPQTEQFSYFLSRRIKWKSNYFIMMIFYCDDISSAKHDATVCSSFIDLNEFQNIAV